MERYKNLNGDSPIMAFEAMENAIEVQFRDRMIYVYSDSSAGSQTVQQMIKLARAGRGLGSFINKFARKCYASKRPGG